MHISAIFIVLILIQTAFYFIQSWNASSTLSGFEALFRDRYVSLDPYRFSQTISDLETIGFFKCVKLEAFRTNANGNEKLINYIDTSFKEGCVESLLFLAGKIVKKEFTTSSGEKWILSFATVNNQQFYTFLWLIRVSLSLLVVTIVELFFFRIRKEKLLAFKEKEKILFENRINCSIAKTTQMLAHDVRKPFSILKAGLNMILSTSDHKERDEIVEKLVPQVDQAMASVNSMIHDIMEIGAENTNLITEPVAPEALIEATLKDIFRIRSKTDISVNYNYKHTYMVHANNVKMIRVMSNIVDNAFQAMDFKGRVWFNTKEIEANEKKYVEFCIGNSGSYISPEDIPMIFDAFFTKGKKSGTGLGLAIAQKIVTSHGGNIWCKSSKEKGTEFYFTLPAADAAKEYKQESKISISNHKPKIAVVDDDVFIQSAWKKELKKDSEPLLFDGPSKFWQCLENAQNLKDELEGIITDYYFDDSEKINGLEFASELKERGFTCPVILCSDGSFSSEELKHIDAVIPKEPKSWQNLNSNIKTNKKR